MLLPTVVVLQLPLNSTTMLLHCMSTTLHCAAPLCTAMLLLHCYFRETSEIGQVNLQLKIWLTAASFCTSSLEILCCCCSALREHYTALHCTSVHYTTAAQLLMLLLPLCADQALVLLATALSSHLPLQLSIMLLSLGCHSSHATLHGFPHSGVRFSNPHWVPAPKYLIRVRVLLKRTQTHLVQRTRFFENQNRVLWVLLVRRTHGLGT